MILALELPPEVEAALAEDARREGTTPERIIADALKRQYVAPIATKKAVGSMAALFAQWAAEDPVTGPEDAAARQREGDELMTALQASRTTWKGGPTSLVCWATGSWGGE